MFYFSNLIALTRRLPPLSDLLPLPLPTKRTPPFPLLPLKQDSPTSLHLPRASSTIGIFRYGHHGHRDRTRLSERKCRQHLVCSRAYFFAFFPWAIMNNIDFISEKWRACRRTRKLARIHLASNIIPIIYVAVYAEAQRLPDDNKELEQHWRRFCSTYFSFRGG